MKQLPEAVGAMISDGLQLLEVLGGSTAGALTSGGLKAYLRRRTDTAREVLFDELGRGDILPPQAAAQDDAAAVAYRYFRSAWEGAARLNLRLLAQAIAGRLRTNTLVADEFLPYADILAAMSRDEIIFVAALFRHSARMPDVPKDQMGEVEKQSPWLKTLEELNAMGWSEDKSSAIAGRCQRSGLVIALSAWDSLAYKISPTLIDLTRTVDFYDALRREASSSPPAR